MTDEDVEHVIAEEDSPTQPPVDVDDVLAAQREEASTGLVAETGPLDLLGHPAEEPALAELINNTGDDGGASSG